MPTKVIIKSLRQAVKTLRRRVRIVGSPRSFQNAYVRGYHAALNELEVLLHYYEGGR